VKYFSFLFINSFIGLVLICHGVCNTLCSYVFGSLVKCIGRLGCFIIAAIINYAMIILMYLWEPVEDQMWILFVIAGLWGVASAAWQSQVIGIGFCELY
jgi:predicted MFS family arabinose efflux permease